MTGAGESEQSNRTSDPYAAAQGPPLRLNQTLALSKFLSTAAFETGSFGTPVSKEVRWLAGEEAVPDLQFPFDGPQD
jgi:hypothetical protein